MLCKGFEWRLPITEPKEKPNYMICKPLCFSSYVKTTPHPVADGLKFFTRVPAEALYILYMDYTLTYTLTHIHIYSFPSNELHRWAAANKRVSSILVDIDHTFISQERWILIFIHYTVTQTHWQQFDSSTVV